VDRLQRSFKESVELDDLRKDGKLEIHFIRENLVISKDSNSSEIQRWDLAVFVAKSYVLQISDNVKRTFDQKIKQGEIIGVAPIGYLNSVDDNGNKTVIPDPDRSYHIQEVFELYSTGNHSMEAVAKIMRDKGLNTVRGATIGRRQVELILKNTFYYGWQIHKGKLYPHKYQPIIIQDLFDKCKEVFRGYDGKTKNHSDKPYIFQGLIKCSNCGCAITPEFKKNKYVYYHCTNHKGTCKKVYLNQNELLKPVMEVLRNISLSQEMIDDITEDLSNYEKSKNNFHEEQLKRLRTNYDNTDRKLSMMYEDRLDGRLTADEYDKKLEEFRGEQNKLLGEMKQYEQANTSYYITANQVLSLAQRAAEIFESSEVYEKRQLLEFVFQNFQLKGKNLLYKLKTPFDTVLLAGATPKGATWGG
jgi:hypothetical protein